MAKKGKSMLEIGLRYPLFYLLYEQEPYPHPINTICFPPLMGLRVRFWYLLWPKYDYLAVDFFELWHFFRLSTCGTTVSQNITYIQNPSYPTGYTTTGNCIFTVTPLSTGKYHKQLNVIKIIFHCGCYTLMNSNGRYYSYTAITGLQEILVMKTGTLQWEQGFPVMKTGFSLWELTYREFPVSLTGFGFAVYFDGF